MLPSLPAKRAVVDAEGHGDGRRVDGLGGQGDVLIQRAKRIGHGGLGHAGQGDDVTGHGLVDGGLVQAAEGQHLGDAELLQLFAGARQGFQRFADLEAAAFDAAGQDAADERVGGQGGGQHAERLVGVQHLTRGRDVGHDHVKERIEVLARAIKAGIGPTGAARGVKMREIQLFVVGAKVGEEVKNLVQRAVGFGVGLVDLVQHHDRAQAQGKRLGGHEFGLRHRAFGGIDQQADAVHHVQDPLDLATKVGVAGGVDDVDAQAVVFNGGAFGQDGDATLAFDVVAVHRAFGHGLIVAERSGLFQKLVNEGCLAMVDMRDDGDVAELHRRGHFHYSAVARALQGLHRKGQSPNSKRF